MGIKGTAGRLATIVLVAAAVAMSPARVQTPSDSAARAAIVGIYDGGQTDMAAGLELGADGHFRYGLSYGALDEQAEGSWTVEHGQVLLTAAPVVPPRFVLLGQGDAPVGQLAVTLDVPEGMSRQYFHAEWRMADGTANGRQLNEDQSPFALDPGERPTSVTLTLPMFDLASDPVPLGEGQGHRVAFRFEPHDLGKAAFVRTPLVRDGRDLILARFDTAIRFRRVKR